VLRTEAEWIGPFFLVAGHRRRLPAARWETTWNRLNCRSQCYSDPRCFLHSTTQPAFWLESGLSPSENPQ